jgi:hypothetical protein
MAGLLPLAVPDLLGPINHKSADSRPARGAVCSDGCPADAGLESGLNGSVELTESQKHKQRREDQR